MIAPRRCRTILSPNIHKVKWRNANPEQISLSMVCLVAVPGV